MFRFIIFLCCLAISFTIASESFLVAGFESEQEVAQWQAPKSYVDGSKMKFNTNPEYITEGKGSAFISFPPVTKGEGRWPRLVLKNIPLNGDWSSYDEISLDIINPHEQKVPLLLQLIIEGGGKIGPSWRDLEKGKHHLTWKLPDAVKTSRVLNLLLFQNDPPEAYSMYVDNIQIHLNKENIEKRIADFFAEDYLNWKESALDAKFKSLKKDVTNLQRSKDSTIKKAETLTSLSKRYSKLKEEHYIKLNEKKIVEFKRQFPDVWGYGITHSLEKVFRKDFPYKGTLGGVAELSLARNEREAFQLVLRSKKELKNVQFSITDLTHSINKTAKLSANQIEILPVGYVKAPKPPYPRHELEWYPDPLLNFLDSFTLDADVWQPVWIDVRSNADTLPGLYQGTICINADDSPELQIPLLVNVWNFALPKQNSLPVVIAHGSPAWFYKKNVEGSDVEQIVKDAEYMLLKHRITPSPIYIAQKAITVEEVKRWQEAGGKEYNIVYIQPHPIKAGQAYQGWARQRVLNLLADTVPKLRDAGVLKDAYIYSFDEIQENSFFAAQGILKEVKELYPDIPLMTTAFDPTFGEKSGLKDYVDIWVPNERSYQENRAKIDAIRKEGKKVWYYTCMYRPGMSFLLEATASAPRLLVGLNQFKEKSDGFLYYQTTEWKSDVMIESGPLTAHNSRGYQAYNGDGVLLYPGRKGVMPTIRLKAIGDGLEDLEYWFMLEKLQKSDIKMSAKDRRTLTALLKINKDVVQNFQIFDFEGDKLQAERIVAGKLLSKYFKE